MSDQQSRLNAKRANERLKLAATLANNLAVGTLVGGILGPTLSGKPESVSLVFVLFAVARYYISTAATCSATCGARNEMQHLNWSNLALPISTLALGTLAFVVELLGNFAQSKGKMPTVEKSADDRSGGPDPA